MKQLRIVVMPVLALLMVLLLFGQDVTVVGIKNFEFIWNVLLGVLLGAVLALLPVFAGTSTPTRTGRHVGEWSLGGLLVLLVMIYQYMAGTQIFSVPALRFLTTKDARILFGEGCVFGYALVLSVRSTK